MGLNMDVSSMLTMNKARRLEHIRPVKMASDEDDKSLNVALLQRFVR